MSHVSSATVADPRLLKAGFAMLQGDDVDFIMRTYDITLGRATAGPPTSKTADVGLGSNLNISRQHARIHYNFEKGCFELIVLGKNGATVSGEPYVPGTPPVALASGTLITICDVSFWFLLPRRSALPSLLAAQSRPAQAVENGSRPMLPPQPSRATQPVSAPQPAAVSAPATAQPIAQAGSTASAGIPLPTLQQNPHGAAQQQLMWQQQQQQLLQQQQQRQQAALTASVSGGGSGGSVAAASAGPASMSQGIASEVTQAQVQAYQAYYAQLQRQQQQQLIQQLAAQQQQQQPR